MGRFLSGLFTARGKPSTPPVASLRVQTSVYGQPIPLILGGQMRMAGNLIWYGGFFSVSDSSSGEGGGKGGLFSLGAGSGGQTSYYASIAFALCEGPIASVDGIWLHSKPRDISAWARSWNTSAVTVNATIFDGDTAQGTWGYLDAHKPEQSLTNRGLAYAGVASFPLGPNPNLQTVNWTVTSTNAFVAAGIPDGDASVAFAQFLTHPHWGLGFPAARLGSLALYQSYGLAAGLLVSPVIASAVQASSFINDLLAATNSNTVWSGGLLTVVPYGDQPIVVGAVQQATESRTIPASAGGSGIFLLTASQAATFVANVQVTFTLSGAPLVEVPNGTAPAAGQYSVVAGVYKFNKHDHGLGVTLVYSWAATASYQPQTRPIYDLTSDNFLPNQGSIGAGLAVKNSPLIVVRKPRDQMHNIVTVEYLDRSNFYNPVVAAVKNDAYITLYGRERPADLKQFHFLCLGSSAGLAATLLLNREQIARTYQFTLPPTFILLDPMDIVTVSDPNQGIFRQPVRIVEIQENADRSLTMTAEEFQGTAAAPLFGAEAPQGFQPGSDADPGNVNPPLLFEPTAELLGGAAQEIWCALSGGASWGGCFVWVSSDGGNTYRKLAGQVAGPARMGVTTSDLPAVAVNLVGPTLDTTHTFGVDLTASTGILAAAAPADAQALRTACYVGGEVVAYANAVLTATSKYDLSYLIRGAYGTEAAIVDHPAGTPFTRLDAGIFQVAFAASDIGQTLFIKFQSFNLYGAETQSLADVGAYPFTIQGVALASPLPTITNLTSAVVDGRLVLSWDEIGSQDFRSDIRYEIRAGATFQGAMTVSIQAHPPFVLPAGTNTYWVTGWCQPVPSLIVRSETAVSIAVDNPQVITNIVASYDLKALGWPGTFVGGGGIDNVLNAVRTGGAGNILADPNVLTDPDILNLGGQQSCIYDPGLVIDAGRSATCPVYVTTVGTGVPVGQNILADLDVLTDPDILGSASAAFVDVYPEIAFSDTVNPPVNWQRFVPGKFTARYYKIRWQVKTFDPSTIGYLLTAQWSVDVPDRVDNALTNGTIPDTGLTLVFQPNGAASPAAFHGGPNGAGLPLVVVTWSGADKDPADAELVTALTLSGCTITIKNGGVGVTRSQCNVFVYGW